ncbi:MAG: murein biosynthesis integral membrane protein MurJ [Candidatus Pacebacteria bacterium]|nr:murein biosynthesis integral membrane protein MurJ [Candidatus Paceibacterota bacterium]
MLSPFPQLSKLFHKNAKWLEKRQNSILSAALIITVANVASSISGLVRERLLISSYFGTEASQKAYEAFQVAFQIPDMLFQLIILGALSAAFIPIFTKYKKKQKEQAFEISATVMNVLLLVFLIFSAVVFVFAYQITAARTGGAFTQRQIQIATNLTRLMLLAQFFFAVSNFLTGILQSFQRFIVPAIAPIIYNAGILLGVFLFSNQLGIYAAGVGVIIGAFLHMLIQLPFAWRMGFRFRSYWKLKNPGVKQIFKMMPLRIMTLGMSEFQNLALGFFATSIGNLSFVVIKLGLRLMALPIRLFGVPIGQASLPFLSEESADKDHKRFKHLVLQSLNQIAFLAFPASVLLLILRIPIVRLVFGTHNFPWRTTVLTGRVVAIIAVSIAAQAMVQLLIRAFHALKDTKTPFIIISLNVLSYLALAWFFVFRLGLDVEGIALATTISAFIELFLFLVFLQKRIDSLFIDQEFLLGQIKIILASFLMAVFLYLPFRILDELIFDTSKTVELIALTITTSTVGSLTYLYFSVLFDIKQLGQFLKMVNRFGQWQKTLAQTEEVFIDGGADGDEI